MEETNKNSTKLSKNKQPVKTEWGAQYVVFTYFQGDINSVVDEHFSRALSVAKNPQDLSQRNSSGNAIVKNDNHVSPHHWGFSPPWDKPYQASPPIKLPSTSSTTAARATETYQPPALQGIPPPPTELWHLPLMGDPDVTAALEYPSSMADLHMGQRSVPDGKYGSLLGLLQQERCPPTVQEPPESSSACLTSSARLQNVNQSLTSGRGIQANDRRRDLYF